MLTKIKTSKSGTIIEQGWANEKAHKIGDKEDEFLYIDLDEDTIDKIRLNESTYISGVISNPAPVKEEHPEPLDANKLLADALLKIAKLESEVYSK